MCTRFTFGARGMNERWWNAIDYTDTKNRYTRLIMSVRNNASRARINPFRCFFFFLHAHTYYTSINTCQETVIYRTRTLARAHICHRHRRIYIIIIYLCIPRVVYIIVYTTNATRKYVAYNLYACLYCVFRRSAIRDCRSDLVDE